MTSKILEIPGEDRCEFGTLKKPSQEMFGASNTDPHQVGVKVGVENLKMLHF